MKKYVIRYYGSSVELENTKELVNHFSAKQAVSEFYKKQYPNEEIRFSNEHEDEVIHKDGGSFRAERINKF